MAKIISWLQRRSWLGRLLAALMRFVLKLDMMPDELDGVADVESNCAKHLSVVNDICSWNKELKKFQESDAEGSMLCSSVKLMAAEFHICIDASKRMLWSLCREWELVHLALVKKREGSRPEVIRYCEGLGYQMSGNEMWSRCTMRYSAL